MRLRSAELPAVPLGGRAAGSLPCASRGGGLVRPGSGAYLPVLAPQGPPGCHDARAGPCPARRAQNAGGGGTHRPGAAEGLPGGGGALVAGCCVWPSSVPGSAHSTCPQLSPPPPVTSPLRHLLVPGARAQAWAETVTPNGRVHRPGWGESQQGRGGGQAGVQDPGPVGMPDTCLAPQQQGARQDQPGAPGWKLFALWLISQSGPEPNKQSSWTGSCSAPARVASRTQDFCMVSPPPAN